MHVQAPFIELLYKPTDPILSGLNPSAREKISWRNSLTRTICADLEQGRPYSDAFYGAIATIMDEQPRLTLYLPFNVLEHAPEGFCDAYLGNWKRCWGYRDIRECFNQGDIYERTARRGEPERIVKAMHLLPWLVQYGYLSANDVVTIVRFMREDQLLCWSAYDALEIMEKREQISRDQSFKIREFMSCLTPRLATSELLVETPARKQWLAERSQNYGVGEEFELRNPTGPFSANLDESVQAFTPKAGQITLIGGSRLKGYGRPQSDYDIYHYDLYSGQILEMVPLCDDIANVAHIILGMAWMGPDEKNVAAAQYEAAKHYISLDAETRQRCLNRMEMDLLQFRLMHKGFPAAHPRDCSIETRMFDSIDGASAFYDDRYRIIATELFIKYLWLP